VAKRLIEMEPRDIGPYVLLSNIYIAEGKWDDHDVESVRRMMKEKGLQKASGSSLVHLGEFESESFVGNGSIYRRSMVYSMLARERFNTTKNEDFERKRVCFGRFSCSLFFGVRCAFNA
jgi:hypothetical protein